MRRRLAVAPLAVWLAAAGCGGTGALAREPVIGLPCEGCEAIFDGLPPTPPSEARIAPPEEPGERLRIEGTVFAPDGRPAPGIVIYAYHTDARGLYPAAPGGARGPGSRHGRLRGWARSDAAGGFCFDTIRPAGYPDSDLPQHVHLHVLEPDRFTYFIDDLLFRDDPRLTEALRRRLDAGRGGSGIATPVADGRGGWLVRRDIVLGAGIPGYPLGATGRSTAGGSPR